MTLTLGARYSDSTKMTRAHHCMLPSRSKAFGPHLFDSSFHRFPGAQSSFTKWLLISSSRNSFTMARQQKQPTWSVRWQYTTRLTETVVSTPKTSKAMRNRGDCPNAVECARRNSLDANDKLIQTRSHERNTIMHRKRRFVMRKGISTILPTRKRAGMLKKSKRNILW